MSIIRIVKCWSMTGTARKNLLTDFLPDAFPWNLRRRENQLASAKTMADYWLKNLPAGGK